MKESLTPYKMCSSKVAYASKKEAEAEVRYWKNSAQYWDASELRGRVGLKSYKCALCSRWHLGHSNNQ